MGATATAHKAGSHSNNHSRELAVVYGSVVIYGGAPLPSIVITSSLNDQNGIHDGPHAAAAVYLSLAIPRVCPGDSPLILFDAILSTIPPRTRG
jgi:hypothetical protein